MNRLLKLVLILMTFVALASCSSDKVATDQGGFGDMDLPDWVLVPTVEDGIAATECVNWSGDFSVDRAEATALARTEIVRQIGIKASALDKTYQEKVKTAGKVAVGGTFTAASKQVSQAYLRGTKAVKVKPIIIDDKKKLCVMVTLSKQQKFFEDILKSSGAKVDPKDQEVLYQEFKAARSQSELAKELTKK
ncbi:MAG: hypothetical protein QNL04_02165 [SAR324 cluster bacterium]|nr:hypothetical protein [SAR324 cluster bacterium]